MDDLLCKCRGVDRRTPCEKKATQEDGLCDLCRCPHGGCDAHGSMAWPESMFEDYDAWIAAFHEAYGAKERCLIERTVTMDVE